MIVSNIVLSIVFCQFWGVYGVAMSTSLSVLFSAVLNMITAKTKSTELSYSYLKKFGLKLVGVTIFSTILSMFVYGQLEMHSFFKLVIVSVICFGVFGVYFFKDLLIGFKGYRNLRK